MSPRSERPLSLSSRFECPAARRDLLGKTETFQSCHSPNHQVTEFGVFARNPGTKIPDTGTLVGNHTQRPIEGCPAFGFNLSFQR